jgi:hypothetical protein
VTGPRGRNAIEGREEDGRVSAAYDLAIIGGGIKAASRATRPDEDSPSISVR